MDNKNNGNNNTSYSGVGFSGLLTIVFIVLKLCGVVAWSWLWVLSPIWITFALVLIVLIFIGICSALSNIK